MREEFETWLKARELAHKTIKQYLLHLDVMSKEFEKSKQEYLTQDFINRFAIRHPTYVTRAFLKNFNQFLQEQSGSPMFVVPEIRGKKNRLRKRLMSEQERNKIRAWLLSHRAYKYVLMFDLTDFCALRREEVVSIKEDDFLWNEWDQAKPLRLKVEGKGRQRQVIVPPKVARRVAKYILNNEARIKGRGIFLIREARWHMVFKEAVRETCHHNFSLHDLRRRRATMWINKGLDLVRVKDRLGHADIGTTQKYIIRSEEEELSHWENEF